MPKSGLLPNKSEQSGYRRIKAQLLPPEQLFYKVIRLQNKFLNLAQK
jgi:hypothetical protein